MVYVYVHVYASFSFVLCTCMFACGYLSLEIFVFEWVCGESWLTVKDPTIPVLKAGHPGVL